MCESIEGGMIIKREEGEGERENGGTEDDKGGERGIGDAGGE